MSLELVARPCVVDDFLADCAARVHAAYRHGSDAYSDATDACFALGHALRDARSALSSDQAFGLWFREQNFGFEKRWALVLRQAAEHEAKVRDEVRSQLRTGKPNIERAVRDVRAALAAAPREEQAVTPILAAPSDDIVEQIRELGAQGLTGAQIMERLEITRGRLDRIIRQNGITVGRTSRRARAERIERMRVLATEGATSAQIAEELGVVIEVVRTYRVRHNIDVPADATTNVRRQIDSTRIVAATIDAIDGIGAMFDHIDYAALPTEQISGWLVVLDSSIRSLTTMKKHLKKASQP